jgi:hypothetical protein
MNDSTCTACGREGGGLRPLPRPDETAPLRFTIQAVCETCIAPSIEALRDIVRRAECADADDADEVDRVLKLAGFLRACGIQGDAGADEEDGWAGARRVLYALLDSLERQLVCSQCWTRAPESRVHLIPYFNNSVGRYVTSFRCDACIESALAETIARVREVDGASELDTLGDLLSSHGVCVHEWQRGAPLDRLRPAMIEVLASLRGQAVRLRLRLGSALPVPAPPRPAG